MALRGVKANCREGRTTRPVPPTRGLRPPCRVLVEDPFRRYSSGPPDQAKLERLIDHAQNGTPDALEILREELKFPESANSLHIIEELLRRRAKELSKELLPRTAFSMVMQMDTEREQISGAVPKERKGEDLPGPIRDPFGWGPKWVEGSRQIRMAELPKEIQAMVRGIYERTYYDGGYSGRHEYVNFAIQLPDGTFITLNTIEATSDDKKSVAYSLKRYSPFLNGVKRKININENLAGGTIKIFSFHSHPQNSDRLDAVEVHSDGSYLTHLSLRDCHNGDRVGRYLVKRLREIGFKGAIEFISGAVPVPLRPQEDISKGLYIAAYIQREGKHHSQMAA